MKKINYIIVLITILLGCKVDNNSNFQLSGNRVTARYDIEEPIKKLGIYDKWYSPYSYGTFGYYGNLKLNLTITKGENYSYEMECDESLLPYIDLSIDNEEFIFEFSLFDHQPLMDETTVNINISAPEVTYIFSEYKTDIDISTFDNFTSLKIRTDHNHIYHTDGNYGSIVMSEVVSVLGDFDVEGDILQLKELECGKLVIDTYYKNQADELITINSTNSLNIYSMENFPQLRNITGKNINLTINEGPQNMTLLTGEKVTLNGNWEVETITADEVYIDGTASITNLTATTLDVKPVDEITIENLSSETVNVNYIDEANLNLPVDTVIDNVTITLSDDKSYTFQDIITNNLEINCSGSSRLTIDDMSVNHLNITNSGTSEVILPSSGVYTSTAIETYNGSISMGGYTENLNIKFLRETVENIYTMDLPNLNSNQAEVELRSHTELMIGSVDSLLYNLYNYTKLFYEGTPTSVSGYLGDYNIYINTLGVR